MTSLDESLVRATLDAALSRGGEWAEVFVEDRRSSSAYLDDGKVEELTSGHDRGAGIRVVVGETTGFAHTADLSENGLRSAAEAAASAARGGGGGVRPAALTSLHAPRPNDVLVLPAEWAGKRTIRYLEPVDAGAPKQSATVYLEHPIALPL